MTINWAERLTAPVDAAEHGVQTADDQFGSIHTGPLSFDRIDYPAAQVYVDGVERAGVTDWEMSITSALYYDWSRVEAEFGGFSDAVVDPLASVIEETLAAFDDVDCIGNYHPARIDFFTGEPANSIVLAISVDFRVTMQMDPGDFA